MPDTRPPSLSTDLGLDPSDPLNLLIHNSPTEPAEGADMITEGSSSSTTSQGGSPPDWSQLASLWPAPSEADEMSGGAETKQFPDLMDIADLAPLTMDMDFNSAMTIEPSALHFDPSKFATAYPTFEESYTPQPSDMVLPYPFSFHSPNLSASDFSSSVTSLSVETTPSVRRLSITSSSGASIASFSPPMANAPSPNLSIASANSSVPLDPAAELAQRVRESAGVMLAVPMTGHLPGIPINNPLNGAFPSTFSVHEQAKIPIPRLPRQSSGVLSKAASPSASSSAASTPPPATPPPSSDAPSPSSSHESQPPTTASSPTTGAKSQRPKTSHTTIERRYRNNLNARIQSLRMAVPALRVLEDREAIASVGSGGKKVRVKVSANAVIRGIKSECLPGGAAAGPDGEVDVIDERGFVDGVKVARKCSKANVLGKAVEYIRVLKRREQRLKAEQSGLKSLISGLVGGPALLREWEREWRERFGGEEKDEVEGENGDADDEDSDDEDEDEDGDAVGKKRKRAKITTPASNSNTTPATAPKKEKEAGAAAKSTSSTKTSAAPLPIGPDGQPEKRKRGRPRKVVPPPVTTSPTTTAPATSSTSPPAAAPPPPIVAQPSQLFPHMEPFHQQQQQHQEMMKQESHGGQQYMLAVFALFSFFNSPLTSPVSSASPHTAAAGAHQGHAHAHTGTVLSGTASHVVAVSASGVVSWRDYVHVAQLGISVVVLCYIVCGWLGVGRLFKSRSSSPGAERDVCSERRTVARKWVEQVVKSSASTSTASSTTGSGADSDEAAPWTSTIGLVGQVQLYRSVVSSAAATSNDLATVALASYGGWGKIVGRRAGRKLWLRARTQSQSQKQQQRGDSLKSYEILVLEEVENVDEAFGLLVKRAKFDTVRPDPASSSSSASASYDLMRTLAQTVVLRKLKTMLRKLFVSIVNGGRASGVSVGEKEELVRAMRELGAGGGWEEELGGVFDEVCKLISGGIGGGGDVEEKVKALLERIRGLSAFGPSSSLANAGTRRSARVSGYDPADSDSGFEEDLVESDEDEDDVDSASNASESEDEDGEGEDDDEFRDVDLVRVVEREIKALLVSLVLYQRLFVVGAGAEERLTYGYETKMMLLELRRALGSRVFESCVADARVHGATGGVGEDEKKADASADKAVEVGVEDARDRVVDMIVEYERGGRRRL
ncbi:hypothetical protein AX16_007548 [Volvariella volvacea WC 439]|nr:hypothetical protein AX16_007548 [Volvariella volvacea WC 439]